MVAVGMFLNIMGHGKAKQLEEPRFHNVLLADVEHSVLGSLTP